MSDAEDIDKQMGDTTMFAVFSFSLLVLGGIPVTWWRISSGGGANQDIVQPWQPKSAKKPSAVQQARKYVNTCNVLIALMWLLAFALGLFLTTVREPQPFDPFDILQVPPTASEAEIKKAYRDLSRKYHPDKNPDPEAHKYFAEFITKAHQTLTDEASRENWIKHGHPDGPQAMSVGVALPEWFFTSNKRLAPLVLFGLVFVGLAIPILIIACYLWRADQYVGSNKIMEQTLYMYHRFCVKESLRVTKIAESIIYANELAAMPFRKESLASMQRFVQAMRREYPALNDKKAIWTLQPALIRAYLMIVAHLDRRTDLVPPDLTKELREVLRFVPVLCEEFVKASVAPRNKFYQGWLAPAQAAVEFQQCLVHQIRPEVRCPKLAEPGKKKAAGGQAVVELLQLPGMEEEEVKNLEKKHKIKGLPELAALPEDRRTAVLQQLGLSPSAVEDVTKTLMSLPHVHVTGLKVYVDGEDDIKQQDVVTVEAFVALRRPSHGALGTFEPELHSKSSGVQAYAPRYPHPVHEKWWIFLADASKNTVWAHAHVDLLEAEAVGAANAATLPCKWEPGSAAAIAGGNNSTPLIQGSDAGPSPACNGDEGAAAADEKEPLGQKVELKFMAPEPGKFDLTLFVMSSCWLGCDVSTTTSVKIDALTGAEKDGRAPGRGKGAKAIPLDDDEKDDADKKKAVKKTEGDSNEVEENRDSDEEGEYDSDEYGDDEGWDTDETGSSVSHDDLDTADPEKEAEAKKTK